MKSKIRVLYVIQGIAPTGPGRHLFKLLAYRNPEEVEARVFAFDYCDPSMMAELAQKYGVQWESVGMRFTSPRTYWHGIPRLREQIRAFQPHIIQTHHTPIVDWVARVVSRWQQVPINLARAVSKPKYYHASRNSTLAWWFIRTGDALTSHFVDYFLPNSEDVLHYLEDEEGIPTSKMQVIANGVDTDYFDWNESLCRQGREFLCLDQSANLIVNIGPLKPLKRQYLLAEAAIQLMRNRQNLHVAFVGKAWNEADDAYMAELKQLIDRAGYTSRFKFAGQLDDVRPLLAASDIYAHPSVVEGSSNALLEAMAMGRACVIADLPSSKELVTHGENGLTVPREAVQELADSLDLLLSDSELRARFGRESRRKVVAHYSVQHMCEEIESVYRRELQAKKVSLIG